MKKAKINTLKIHFDEFKQPNGKICINDILCKNLQYEYGEKEGYIFVKSSFVVSKTRYVYIEIDGVAVYEPFRWGHFRNCDILRGFENPELKYLPQTTIEDLSGRKSNMLTAISYDFKSKKWICKCECGNICKKTTSAFKKDTTCGCLSRKITSITNKTSALKRRDYDLSGDYGICLLDGVPQFIFDIDDYLKIKNLSFLDDGRAIITNVKGKSISIPYFILGIEHKNGIDIDHINRNYKDNRKDNLRVCTHGENMLNRGISKRNTSGVIGVGYDKHRDKWRAFITIDHAYKTIGRYETKEEAIINRLNYEKKLFGEFAPQKHLYAEYGII